MAHIRASFEKELVARLAQKSNLHQSDESILLKNFKYFDLNNSGDVNASEFIKVIEKIGIPIFNKQEFNELFNYYDTNRDGKLDYKEFAAILFDNSSANTRKDSPQKPSSQMRANDYFQGHSQQDSVARFQDKLRSRGATGILGIARQFRIFDDNNSRSIELSEFIKGVRDFQIDLNENEILDVFNYFDRNKDNSINYDEFLLGVRGPINSQRRKLIQQAFSILDKDGSGIVDIEDIKNILQEIYTAKYHPDVINHKKTEDQVLLEFLSTFEYYSEFKGITDGKITPQEFEDYYSFISASIDRDDYFQLMMNNAWRMNEGANRNWDKPGWQASDQKQQGTLQSAYKNNNQANLQRQQQENNNQVNITPQKSVRSQLSPQQNPPSSQRKLRDEEKMKKTTSSAMSGHKQEQQFSQQNYQNQPKISQPQTFDVQDILKKLRAKLAARGTRGYIGIQRQFRIMDDNYDKCLTFSEFRKAMNDYKMQLTEDEVEALFSFIDLNGNGVIEIDELVKQLQGEMSNQRRQIVDQAYQKIPKRNDGTLTITDIKRGYSAKNLPDVRKGIKTEDEVLGEFLETFELHHNLRVGTKDQKVTIDEFREYYNNVSSNIDNDSQFEALLLNAYRLQPTDSQKISQGQNILNGGISEYRSKTIQNAPFGTSNTPTDYSTSLRPKIQQQQQQIQQTAGSPSWPGYNYRPQTPQQQKIEEESVKRGSNKDQYDNLSMQSNMSSQSQRSFPQSQFSQSGDNLLNLFKSKILQRGTRGILNISRLFKIIDDSGNKSLSKSEFQKACKDMRIGLNESQANELFDAFDRNKSGKIEFSEFLRQVRGQMNQFRQNLVLAVFAKLDINKNKKIELDDILGTYNASKHPDVLSRKKTEEEVLGDFLDTFEQHHAIQVIILTYLLLTGYDLKKVGVNSGRDKSVSVDEFIEYYNNVSALIDDDKHFELMIKNGWKI